MGLQAPRAPHGRRPGLYRARARASRRGPGASRRGAESVQARGRGRVGAGPEAAARAGGVQALGRGGCAGRGRPEAGLGTVQCGEPGATRRWALGGWTGPGRLRQRRTGFPGGRAGAGPGRGGPGAKRSDWSGGGVGGGAGRGPLRATAHLPLPSRPRALRPLGLLLQCKNREQRPGPGLVALSKETTQSPYRTITYYLFRRRKKKNRCIRVENFSCRLLDLGELFASCFGNWWRDGK